ncbi:MAG: DNA internalization-related competence protein ComEC/Rec2 [Syntrophus sp. (in: bacteria)]|nr:DNA internalization-related competence protein ComEC/Rec2 [Syntrophus sp. (in: bacteria)]
MFVISVLFFIAGIYIQAIYPFSLIFLSVSLLIPLSVVPFLIKIKPGLALYLMVLLFMCVGMIRLGTMTLSETPVIIDEQKGLYEGIVVEASPNTKIVRITKPADLTHTKVLFRNTGDIKINDKVKVFGQMRELSLTFNNPSLTSWKWLKRLEGISYEIKGTLISISPGTNYIHAWRNWLSKRIDASGAKHRGVIKALTIGDTTGLDEETKTLFLKTGTSHILAISGSNIGIVTAFFFFIARFLIRRSLPLRLRGDDIRYAALLSIPFAFMFMVTAGSSIPTIRATIMITVFMLSLFFERGRHMINTIFLSALVILLIYPHSLFTASFQLTFMSVLFIVICTERFYPLMRIENRIVKWFLSSILMTLAATIGTLPIVIYHFYGINPFSVIHNLVAVPLMCIIAMPMSLIGLILPWGDYLLRFSGEVLEITMRILEYMNRGYIYPIIRPTLFECGLFFCLATSIIYIQKRIVCVSLILVLMPFSSAYVYHEYTKRFYNTELCLNFIDVGLGDAILVEAPQGIRMLIDGGGLYKGDYDTGKSIITPLLLSRKIMTLDYVVNTHPHGDHAGGLMYVLRHFKVRMFATGTYFMREAKFIDLLTLLKERKISPEIWKKGNRVFLKGNSEIHVFNPGRNDTIVNPNDSSLVFAISYKNMAFLLTGDIGKEVEEKLVMEGAPLKAQVLKIPHHGSRHSSSPAFVRSIKPDLAILTVGKGIKGLPAEDALNLYRDLAIPVLRTDINGFIRVCTDGNRITCEPFRKIK